MGLTVEQFRELKKKVDSASEDNTPYPVVDGANVSVIGDANLTEVKKNDYTVKFGFPKDRYETKPQGAEETPMYYMFTVDYKGISINPRGNLGVAAAVMDLLPFFKELKEDGGVENLRPEDTALRFMRAKNDIQLAVYNLVATFLGISDEDATWMEPMSVIATAGKILSEHPEIINEAELFFGLSTEKPVTMAQR